MSQDTGLWSVRRSRETTSNHTSTLPQPAQSLKRSSMAAGMTLAQHTHVRSLSGSRQSLAMPRPNPPKFPRPSAASSIGDSGLSSVKRTSTFPTKQLPTPSMATAATPGVMTEAERRSSIYRSRTSTAGSVPHQSFFQAAPQIAGVPRDPRPLKDRSYQTRIGQELIDYMVKFNFEHEMKHVLSQNIMKSPTQKDFNYMFQWLYHRIDPSHKFQKNIDQEVPPILKQLRYPYERSITKSQIAAVGGQNWSTFLGLLHWMMQLAQMLDGYSSHRYDGACLDAGIDVSGDHIIFSFLSQAYRDWLAMDEDVTDEDAERLLAPHVERMANAFQNSNSQYKTELETLEAENTRLQKEIEELEKQTPDPAILDNNFKIMEEDKAKFEEYNALAAQRTEKYEARIKVLQEELDKMVQELKDAEEERRNLQRVVDEQGISMQDIDRMTADRERLQKGIETTSGRLEEVKRQVADREAEASRRLDELERIVSNYNSLAYQIGLIPSNAINAKGHNYELQIIVSDSDFTSNDMLVKGSASSASNRLLADATTGYQPAHILNLDLRGKIKETFSQLRQEISQRRTNAMHIMLKDHERLDHMGESIQDKQNDVETLGHRVREAEQEYERSRELTLAQKMGSDAQIEKIEKELSKFRTELSESVQLMEQREMNTNIEYEQMVVRVNAMREELHTEIERMLNDVIKFKLHVQKNLDDFENFVADEVEKELERDEAEKRLARDAAEGETEHGQQHQGSEEDAVMADA
ncbi:hypothetical protein TD95_004494 [Thielaviopsis punctulata]|uniref:Kinetochore protein NDC80 n=1 Tax=Thielaviopsis punctulata TaxID=72032 RepID=A0A0F4ZE73_9PEZI|nr:hypothetical protein TD95_004494 [Thielaviopsis punctulata]